MPEDPVGTGSQPSLPLGGGGSEPSTGSLDWGTFKEGLGDLGKDKAFEPIKDFKGLASSFVNSQKMIGNSIRLPAKDAKPEDRQKAVNEILGKLRSNGVLESIPETPDKYEIKMPTVEGFKANEPLLKSFKEHSHKTGKTPSQAQADFDWYLNYQEETDRQEQVEFETMKQGLKTELAGLYPRKMEAARRAAAKYLGIDGDEVISQLPPAIGKRIVMAFAEIGEPMLEEALTTGSIPGVITKEQVKAKIDAMMNDKLHPLNDLSNRQHNEAVEEYSKLQQEYIRLGGKF
jgi:hypothetical protein